MAEQETGDPRHRVASRKMREGLVVSDKMQSTVIVAVIERVRHAHYGKTVQRTKRALRPRRRFRRPHRRPGPRRRDPAALEAQALAGRPRCWSVPDDPTGVAPQGGRQLRRTEVLCIKVLGGSRRRYAQHRGHLRRHGEGRHPGCGGEEGRGRASASSCARRKRSAVPTAATSGSTRTRRCSSTISNNREEPASSARSGGSCVTRGS